MFLPPFIQSNFYPRPPGGGRHGAAHFRLPCSSFLSTPSGWRATRQYKSGAATCCAISIHALRVEGDTIYQLLVKRQGKISIHALRVEGDNPEGLVAPESERFLSTPSGWRATGFGVFKDFICHNFYPRPPGGGRQCLTPQYHLAEFRYFYPRPPGGGRRFIYVR
mgnify:CR=1 FL=1